ncbi:MAG: hypothetical protein V1678_00650 [Candidatus Aenigmatarchaeota archaeon]
MRSYFIFSIICLLILATLAYSSSIEIVISQNINVNVTHEQIDASSNLVKFTTEVYNTGSVPYSARIRTYVYNEDRLVFDGWSQEKALMPGDKKTFDTYWHADSKGGYNTTLRVYYGNEMMELSGKPVEIANNATPEDFFEVRNFRTYDNYVMFEIESKIDEAKVKIIPIGYVPGWIFEQRNVEEVKSGLFRAVKMDYYPTLWQPTDLKLVIVTQDGKHYSEKTLKMAKGSGIENMFYSILDSIKSLFS